MRRAGLTRSVALYIIVSCRDVRRTCTWLMHVRPWLKTLWARVLDFRQLVLGGGRELSITGGRAGGPSSGVTPCPSSPNGGDDPGPSLCWQLDARGYLLQPHGSGSRSGPGIWI